MSSSTKLAIAGIVAAVCVTIGQDLSVWEDWSKTFQPPSIGRLLVIVGGAIGGWVAGRSGMQNTLDEDALADLLRDKLRAARSATDDPPQ